MDTDMYKHDIDMNSTNISVAADMVMVNLKDKVSR